LAYHELPETLPFNQNFTIQYQNDFLNNYFMRKERFLHLLPYQAKILTKDELVQKYDSYLPAAIKSFTDLLEFVGIGRDELGIEGFLDEDHTLVPDLDRQIRQHFPVVETQQDALRILLLDLSQHFSGGKSILYDLVEPPLGLMSLLTYLNREYGGRVRGKIAKSRLDFDNYGELKGVIEEFQPDLIGIRTLTFYKEFFHETVAMIRLWGVDVPIICGGPYATSNYAEVLQNRNIDLVVLGEGEITFSELVEKILEAGGKLPHEEVLKEIRGVAFIPGNGDLAGMLSRQIILLDELTDLFTEESAENLENFGSSSDPAFAIFTSGSTGKPKGTILHHQGINNHVWTKIRELEISSGDILCHNLNVSFVASIWQFFAPLFTGARLYIYPEDIIGDPYRFFEKVAGDHISLVEVVPSFLNVYLELLGSVKPRIELDRLRMVVLTGERVTPELVNKFYRNYRLDLVNAYGQSECSDDTLHYKVPYNARTTIVPIGKPANNTEVYVLGRDGQPQPLGVAGELYVGGHGLAAGYLNDVALTADRFVAHPFKPAVNLSRMFRTGDLGRWLSAGIVEFLGRVDQQVKIRGHRIELGEIESQLLNHDGVKDAAVVVKGGAEDKYLCAYLVLDASVVPDSFELSGLADFLTETLPDYMIPAHFVKLAQLPLTPSGKIDRKALPEPDSVTTRGHIAPRDKLENKLTEIWARVLKREKDQVSIDANFFEIGGHSLRATTLISMLHQEFDVKVPLTAIFDHPTVERLAGVIRGAAQEKFVPIRPVEKRGYYALSSAQKRLFVLQQMGKDIVSYNIPLAVEIGGAAETADREKIQEIFRILIKRHESLRTSFAMLAGEPVQRVHNEVDFAVDFCEAGEDDVEELVQDFISPFDLEAAPLLRGLLLKVAEDRHILVVDKHHIVSDGTSLNILVSEFTALYGGEELPALRVQYKDFSEWQRSNSEQGNAQAAIDSQQAFWLEEFAAEIPVLNLPTDYPRPAVQDFEGEVVQFQVGVREIDALRDLTGTEDTTRFMVLLSIFNILLSKICDQEDVVVGTPVAGRTHTDLEHIIGMFVNTLALRNFPVKDKTFKEFLKEVRDRTLLAFENQNFQFEDLVEKVAVNRDISRNPLFDVMFVLQNIDIPDRVNRELELRKFSYKSRVTKFDMSWTAVEGGENIHIAVEYFTSLFNRETIERFVSYFKEILSRAFESSGTKISELEVMSADERNQILYVFNRTGGEFPADRTLHELIETQAAARPDHMALAFESEQLTYGQLNERAAHLAGILIDNGVECESIVGLMAERSLEIMVAILAIFKAGAAYLPIDPDYPQWRIKYMIADSCTELLLVKGAHPGDWGLTSLYLGDVGHYRYNKYVPPPPSLPASTPGSPAYVSYTSGSTGKPKGVLIEHRSVVNFITGMTGVISFSEDDCIFSLTTISFDIFGLETILPLTKGSRVILGNAEEQLNPEAAVETLWRKSITILQATPSRLQPFVSRDEWGRRLQRLKYLLVGGEIFPRALLERLRKLTGDNGVRIYNLYGPTETTIWSAVRDVTDSDSLDIGKPILNTGIYILSKEFSLQPLRVPGELYIAGMGVARGYLNSHELTAERFVENGLVSGGRLYRTGDLARWQSDGNLEFLGRVDNQIKLRGFRIEPGEIESELLQIDYIKEAVVIDNEKGIEGKYLCAYVVLDDGGSEGGRSDEVGVSELRNILAGKLPRYMIPSYFVPIDEIPLTPNGKVDRKALPDPEIKAGKEYAAPRSRVERVLAGIWAEVLNVERGVIGVGSHFFELGGHSLKAINVVTRIHREFNVKIPLTEIFRRASLEELARVVDEAEESLYTSIEVAEEKEYYVLSSAQKRMYILQQMEPENTSYNMPLRKVLEGHINKEGLEEAFRELIARHDSLRTSFFWLNEQPVQKIHRADEVGFFVDYYECMAGQDKAKEIVNNFVKPFDLSRAPLLRVGLISLGEMKYILMVDMHHIIADGISLELLLADFYALYDGRRLSELKYQYKDYAEWQNSEDQLESIRKQEEYWLKEFRVKPPVLHLPTDYPRPKQQGFEGDSIQFEVEENILYPLKQLAESRDATLFMVLLAVFNILLSRLSGQDEIVVGSPVAGRRHADVENVIGMFVNSLTLKNSPRGEKRFSGFLGELKQKTLEVLENQDYQFEDLVEKVVVTRDTSRNPLFDLMFMVQNQGVRVNDNIDGGSFISSDYHFDGAAASRFDMMWVGVETGGALIFHVEFCLKLFKKDIIERFINYYKRILSAVIDKPNQKILEIDILSVKEKNQLLYDFNSARVEYPQDKALHRLFSDQAERTPDHIAVVGEVGKMGSGSLSFGALNSDSGRMTAVLRRSGLAADDIAGIMLERTPKMVEVVMAVFKAGAACFLIDPNIPVNRIKMMLQDCRSSILIANAGIIGNTSPSIFSGLRLVYDDLPMGERLRQESAANFTCRAPTAGLAFVVFTSGSTGSPKGTVLYHRGVVNHVFTKIKELGFDADDILCHSLNISFVASIWQFFASLFVGAKLHIYLRDVISDPYSLFKRVDDDRVSILEVVPSMLNTYLELLDTGKSPIGLKSLRALVLTGEKVIPSLVNRFYKKYRTTLMNAYGQSECSDDTFHYRIPFSTETKVVPIGRPANNTEAYVLNKYGQLQPMGVQGELYIGGDGLSVGYLNRPELTKTYFVPNPYDPEDRVYRTGDLVRYLPDGNIEFLGRIDHQVKIRGHRIELEEIERHLLRYGEVKEAAVEAKGDGDHTYLCAYIVPHSTHSADSADSPGLSGQRELREYLRKELPDYMIPSYFIQLEKLPLTSSGKLDRKALPDPETTEMEREGNYQLDDIEGKLAKIWSAVLRKKEKMIGLNTNFFESGGNSLKALVCVSRIHRDLHVRISLADMFFQPTLKALSEVIREAVPDELAPIEPTEEKEYYALSSAQKRLFVLQQMGKDIVSYNIPVAVEIEGAIDREEIGEIFWILIKRHESLRTSFALLEGEPVQKVHDEVDFSVDFYEAGKEGVEELVQDFIKPFDLGKAPLLRALMVRMEDRIHVLVVDIHHIVSDGTSLNVLVSEFMALYGGELLPILKLRYKDYSEWQSSEDQLESIRKQEEYWLKEFRAMPPLLHLPTDYGRPKQQSFEGSSLEFEVCKEEADGLKKLAASEEATLFMLLLAVFDVLLAKVSDQEDIVIGTPVAGRHRLDLERIIGMFVNTLPLRNFPVGGKPFSSFLREIRQRTLAAFENQSYQYEDLVELLPVKRDMSRNPLFDVMLVLQNMDLLPGEGKAAGQAKLLFREYRYENRTAKFDLSLFVEERGENLCLLFEYCTRLFKRKSVERLVGYFRQILTTILKEPELNIAEIEIISIEERESILYEYNRTQREYRRDMAIPGLFEERVRRFPDNTVLVFGTDRLTYGELNRRVNRLASMLRERGLKRGELSAVMLDRSFEMIVGILAILKAGGVYVPIDPAFPLERKKYILADSDCKMLLLQEKYGEGIEFEGESVDPWGKDIYVAAGVDLELVNKASDLIYAIYTSGSTGRPKGTLVTHGSVVNILTNMEEFYPLGRADSYLLKTNYTFDVSVTELFGWIFGLGKLVISGNDEEKDPEALIEAIWRYNVTHINFVPSMLNAFLDVIAGDEDLIVKLKGLKYALVAGEAFPRTLAFKARELKLSCRFENIFGPTEATIYTTGYSLSFQDDVDIVPIGRPLANIKNYVVNRDLKLQPINVAGELCIGGLGLARGYLNRPELTHERFVSDPFLGAGVLYRMYRTGDLARWLPDGNIEFMGRIDQQVKIRGFRIELEEIESRLLSHGEIKEAVVTVGEDGSGDKYLCGYIVPCSACRADLLGTHELKEYLSGVLPGYMIPSYFVQLAEIPLTSSGKIDRSRLPEPDRGSQVVYAAPVGEVERKLSQIWSGVLGLGSDVIGRDSGFFDLGGHSLKAIDVIGRIHREFNVKVSLSQIFERSTVKKLSAFIEAAARDKFVPIRPVEEKSYYVLSSAQRRMYILQQLEQHSIRHNMAMRKAIEGEIDKERLEATFRELIKRHESLRTSFILVDEVPVQRVHKAEEIDFSVAYHDVVDNEELAKEIIDGFVRPFDLSRAPLLRVVLVRTEREKNILMVDMHHIISDGMSLNVIFRDFMSLYMGEGLSGLRIQYRDYAEWQNSEQQRRSIESQEAYWLGEFTGEPERLNLPTDYARPLIQSFEGASIDFELADGVAESLKSLARSFDATLFMVLLSAFNILLSRLSGQEEIVVGSPTAGRRHADLGDVIGMFINTLVLRSYPVREKSFSEFVEEVKQTALAAIENQDYQFEELVEKVSVRRDTSRNPLFDVLFMVISQNDPLMGATPDSSGDELNITGEETGVSRFDLMLRGFELHEGLLFNIEYCTKLFKRETIERFIGYFERIISSIVENPAQMVSQIEVISLDEKDRLLYEFNDTVFPYPGEKTIAQLFEDQAARSGQAAALLFEGEQLRYGELNERSNRLAGLLKRRGVRPGEVVGIMVRRSVEMVVGMLAVLKAGGACFLVDADTPLNRIVTMLEDCGVRILLAEGDTVKEHSFSGLLGLRFVKSEPRVTGIRPQITDPDRLPLPDRRLISYEKYDPYIGDPMVKNSYITMQATRGCPFNCAYCHKIWPKRHVFRSAGHIFEEVKLYYEMGVRRFSFVDDVFNLNVENSSRFYRLLIENKMDVQLFFPSGFRGDILSEDYIDLMVEAGTVLTGLALETASPRLQKLMGKNLNLERFGRNAGYFCRRYPEVILEFQTMHGFPTETEEEALLTLEFIKSLKWLHFPYVNILRIYTNTDMEKLALENGISREAIVNSEGLAYHELPETLPFSRSFTLKYQADFMNEYFLSKARLLHILPYQAQILTMDELVQKYDSYLPVKIGSYEDLLQFTGIRESELGIESFLDEDHTLVADLDRQIRHHFPAGEPHQDALRILLLDLSQHFSGEAGILYDLVEPPLGLMSLLTYLNREFGGRVRGKIAKSRLDFDNYAELKDLIEEFQPDLIGIRTLTFYKEFFHQTVSMIRLWGVDVPIICGGPYATSNYAEVLQNRNIDVVVHGEGEVTFAGLIAKMLENGGRLPGEDELSEILGISFIPGSSGRQPEARHGFRQIVLLDRLTDEWCAGSAENLRIEHDSSHPAFVIFTSGSTGRPKGTLLHHRGIVNHVFTKLKEVDGVADDVFCHNLNVSFVAGIWQFFAPLFIGARLHIYADDVLLDPYELFGRVCRDGVSIVEVVPSVLKTYLDVLEAGKPAHDLRDLRKLILTGEKVMPLLVNRFYRHYRIELLNAYGQSECCDDTLHYRLPYDLETAVVPIGVPSNNTRVYVLSDDGQLQPLGVAGELYIGGDGVALGYLNDPELTAERFVSSRSGGGERLYRSGDLCRWLVDGNIVYLGRIDDQVKIRGHRIELAEIESRMLKFGGIRGAVVRVFEEESGDKNLCGYIVWDCAGGFEADRLRDYLQRELPGYMVPSYFVLLAEIPLTVSGKVDRRALPGPRSLEVVEESAVGGDEIEEKLIGLWSDVLKLDGGSIGLDANFFQLGGNSLRSVILAARIHKELAVNLTLTEIFEIPTIRGLSSHIRGLSEEQYAGIGAVEEREYYGLSSAQKRLYIVYQMDEHSTAYNIPIVREFEGVIEGDKLERAFVGLIDRHESLRTSFFMLGGEPVQRIYRGSGVEFGVEYNEGVRSESAVQGMVRDFIRPFDLGRAPLLRVGLVESDGFRHVLMVDMHHIVSDGTSMHILLRDFMLLHDGVGGLRRLSIRYRDFAVWQGRERQSGSVRKQEEFWLGQFKDGVAVLHLPTDYPRPAVQSFEGDRLDFRLGERETEGLKKLAADEGATLFMVLQAIFNVLLYKLTGQEDIVMGTPVAGRRHADLEGIIGMFVNTLPLRNYPGGEKTFKTFLREVSQSILAAFENQDYPFENLLETVNLKRDTGRSPLFDIVFTFQNMELIQVEGVESDSVGLHVGDYRYDHSATKFDLTFVGYEIDGKIQFVWEYCTKLFLKERIERFRDYFKEIVAEILEDKEIELKDIRVSHDLLTARRDFLQQTRDFVEF
jgi:tyrocidine synthetase-3